MQASVQETIPATFANRDVKERARVAQHIRANHPNEKSAQCEGNAPRPPHIWSESEKRQISRNTEPFQDKFQQVNSGTHWLQNS